MLTAVYRPPPAFATMEAPGKIAEVDFRFAGAEDTAEILSLVNNAFSVEKGDPDLAFTTRDRVNKEEVDACLSGAGGKKRWLVLETPHPEEKMAAACLICTGSTPGTGSVEVLAVEPTRQREGLGSHMLRRAEGILLNFRCRFVKMKVPQWREDVLGWAAKQGYKETGGGVWGELDGEDAEDLTRPTRYFVLTRDLLTDKKVVGTFGDGTARFTAATAAAADRAAAAANDLKPASKPASSAVPWRAEGESAKGREAEDEGGRLAGFLSTVLKGLVDAEEEDQNIEESGDGGKNLAAAPIADIAVGESAPPTSSEVLSPPLPPATSNKSRVSAGVVRDLGSTTTSGSTAKCAASSSVSASNDELEVVGVQSVCGGDVDTAGGAEEESVEDLLSSLMRTLNTEQGRADFRLLASGATS